jgi:hypothetical protein
VAATVELEPDDQLQLLQRRNFVQETVDAGLDE